MTEQRHERDKDFQAVKMALCFAKNIPFELLEKYQNTIVKIFSQKPADKKMALSFEDFKNHSIVSSLMFFRN